MNSFDIIRYIHLDSVRVHRIEERHTSETDILSYTYV